jgi:proteasome lid subunit RPN8/RPN11
MLIVSDDVRRAMFEHAQQEYSNGKRECCGVVIEADDARHHYIRCTNVATEPAARDSFRIAPRDLAEAEELGKIVAIVHSHPDASAHPSDADRYMCERSGVTWLIIGMPDGVVMQCQPNGQRLPLVGREFHHGVVDCYTLIQDYYAERLGVVLPNFDRSDDWWTRGDDLYRRNFAVAGFDEVGTLATAKLQQHDVLLMKIRSTQENHAAIVEDASSGLILHHLYGQLSGHDILGGFYARRTTAVLRHKSLIEVPQ